VLGREKDKGTKESLGFGGGVELFIGLRRPAASIGSVRVAAVDRAPGSSPPSCFLFEEDDDEEVSWAGPSAGCGCWAAT
jgi:hypothetical protein